MNKELFYRILSSVILLPLGFLTLYFGSYYLNFFLLISFIISVIEWNNISKNFFIKISGIFFLFISFWTIFLIRNDINNDFKVDYLFMVLIICICTDTGGYFFGKLFKGPKLTKISPNKTYTGVCGSFLFPLIVLIFLTTIFEKEKIILSLFETNFNFYIFILGISLVSQFGDLTISFFKRLSNMKNTGKIIPGHGGLLDRVDGMIFAFPTAYILYNYLLT